MSILSIYLHKRQTIFTTQVPHIGPPQGSYLPMALPPSYIHFDETAGWCEALLVVAAILLWFYSFYRLYIVWRNILNFSESSIQGPQGWDFLVNWLGEMIRLRRLKDLIDTLSKVGNINLKVQLLISHLYIYFYLYITLMKHRIFSEHCFLFIRTILEPCETISQSIF